MAGCSSRVSRGTRTRRQPLRRWPRSETTGQSQAGAGSEHRRGAPRTGPSASRSATRQPRTQGGITTKGSRPPPLTATLLCEREPRSGLPTPSPDFLPPFREGAAADPAPNPPASAAGLAPAQGGAATTASQPPPKSERPPHGGGRGAGGQPVGRPAREGGGGARAFQPTLGTAPSHGHGQVTGARRVARALHPKQAQQGSGSCGGRHSKQGTSTKTPSPSRSTRPFRSGLHHIGSCDAARG